jgi:hypothetical protein
MKAYIICGIGHSGTRLLFNLIKQHPLVTIPDEQYLQGNGEYLPLQLQIEREICSKYHNHYLIDKQKIFNEIEKYVSLCDLSKRVLLMKVPTYSLFVPEVFLEYFGNSLRFLYTIRDSNKIFNSYKDRNEVEYIMSRLRMCGLFRTYNLDMEDILNQLENRVQYIETISDIKKIYMPLMCTHLDYFIEVFNNLDLPMDTLSAIQISSIIEKGRI